MHAYYPRWSRKVVLRPALPFYGFVLPIVRAHYLLIGKSTRTSTRQTSTCFRVAQVHGVTNTPVRRGSHTDLVTLGAATRRSLNIPPILIWRGGPELLFGLVWLSICFPCTLMHILVIIHNKVQIISGPILLWPGVDTAIPEVRSEHPQSSLFWLLNNAEVYQSTISQVSRLA